MLFTRKTFYRVIEILLFSYLVAMFQSLAILLWSSPFLAGPEKEMAMQPIAKMGWLMYQPFLYPILLIPPNLRFLVFPLQWVIIPIAYGFSINLLLRYIFKKE